MTDSAISQTTFGGLTALTASVFIAGAALADELPAGQSFVDRVLTPEAQLCVEDALRDTVGDPDAEVKSKVTFDSDGDYSRDLSIVTVDDDFISRSAGIRFSADADGLRAIWTSVSSENVFDPERVASLSVAGATIHFDNEASESLAEYTLPAEVSLHNQSWTCLYGEGHGDAYPTETLDPVQPKL